jgi:hypothetical protein
LILVSNYTYIFSPKYRYGIIRVMGMKKVESCVPSLKEGLLIGRWNSTTPRTGCWKS